MIPFGVTDPCFSWLPFLADLIPQLIPGQTIWYQICGRFLIGKEVEKIFSKSTNQCLEIVHLRFATKVALAFFFILTWIRKWEFDNITIGHIKVIWVMGISIQLNPNSYKQCKVGIKSQQVLTLSHICTTLWIINEPHLDLRRWLLKMKRDIQISFKSDVIIQGGPVTNCLNSIWWDYLKLRSSKDLLHKVSKKMLPMQKNTHKCRFRPICTPK